MLCAALLHDAGHFPYAHSLKELPLASHEELAGILVQSAPLAAQITAAGGDPACAAAIIDGGIDAKGEREIIFYRKLLSGCLDPDKLDYLSRDARYCGVPYGAQDIDFIFSTLYPHPERGVDIDERGIPNVEAILFSKYMMYRSVYWHHSVRCATAMVKKAVLAGLIEGFLQPSDLYNLTDMELFNLMSKMLRQGHAIAGIGLRVYHGQLFSLAAEFAHSGEAFKGLDVITNRPLYEKKLAAALSAETGTEVDGASIIIDVPEPFSFETDLFIRGKNCAFDESSSFFAGKTAETCVKSLAIVRVFMDNVLYSGREALFSTALRAVFASVAGC
jgi:hypothetical protein